MKRVALLCPGRGSYTEKSLRSLSEAHPWVARADELRAERGLLELSHLDGAGRFSTATHLKPSNVAPLIWLVTMIDAERALAEHECACIAGNSLGWYTALAVAGALDFDDGFRLVQEMALLQEQLGSGGQLIYPLVDEDWRRDAQREAAVLAALESAGGQAFPSIALGGYAVLAGSEAGLEHVLRSLPQAKLGANTYPLRLVQHGAYHTPLASAVAQRASETLSTLAFKAPRFTLIDGRGVRFTPWSCDVGELRRYTLGAQVDRPYDFTLSVRVALREHAPEQLVLPGPGNTLGGVCGQILAAEGWRGIRSKADFERAQQESAPIVVSMRR